MRISVTDIGRTFGRQTRAYAEYRVFSTLAQFGDTIDEARVSLASKRAGDANRCVVSVNINDGRHLRVSATGRHAYEAINRAVERIRDELRRPTDRTVSP